MDGTDTMIIIMLEDIILIEDIMKIEVTVTESMPEEIGIMETTEIIMAEIPEGIMTTIETVLMETIMVETIHKATMTTDEMTE
jgi:hypothetical protein